LSGFSFLGNPDNRRHIRRNHANCRLKNSRTRIGSCEKCMHISSYNIISYHHGCISSCSPHSCLQPSYQCCFSRCARPPDAFLRLELQRAFFWGQGDSLVVKRCAFVVDQTLMLLLVLISHHHDHIRITNMEMMEVLAMKKPWQLFGVGASQMVTSCNQAKEKVAFLPSLSPEPHCRGRVLTNPRD
jgi:hypothetical protein